MPKLVTWLLHMVWRVTRGMTLGVRVAAFDEAGRVFLVRHTYVPGWHFPGGGVEPGETFAAAAIKEMEEEGHLVARAPLVLSGLYLNLAASRRDHVALFVCQKVEQTRARLPDREIAESGFFPPDRLPEGTTPATRRRLAEIAAGTTGTDPHW